MTPGARAAVASPSTGEPPPGPLRDLDFPGIFEAHFDYVWNTLRRLGVQRADVEDVTHDVFVAVLRKLDQYDPERPLRPWLFGFAFRVASDYRELARHRFEHASDDGELEDGRPSALDNAMQHQELGLAKRALTALELGRRAVFILHELDACPMPEVARALGIPLNTAYSRLRLARADLAAAARRLRLQGDP
ncbi:MAG TPA: sigma-70 family RNA polymerase sigma factor [Polyangiaceae bacterium]